MCRGRGVPARGKELTSLQFWKMNGAGNDFVIVDNRRSMLPDEAWPEIARTLCERHLSIGADGLMVVDTSDRADYRMRYYNSDGSLGEMCGNGARCICRYGYENWLAGEVQTVETTAGLVTGWRLDQRNYRIRLNDPSVIRLDAAAHIGGTVYAAPYVELGDPGLPHVAVEVPGLADCDRQTLRELGRRLRYYEGYPKGANVNFYEVVGPDHVRELTYERGVEDFTYACGTGTGSVVTVLTLLGRVSGQNVRVDMPGGQLTVDVVCDGPRVTDLYLTGPTNIVCRGEATDEDCRFCAADGTE